MSKLDELPEELRLWYRRAFNASREESGTPPMRYVISWWLREDFGYPTPEVNKYLNKLCKHGLMKKETTPGRFTQYYFVNTNN